jgi:hypothetical protein
MIVGSVEPAPHISDELAEQCRLNGMGAEREARLMAQLQEAERKLAEAERNALERAAKACYDDESGRDGGGYYADIIRALIKEGGE